MRSKMRSRWLLCTKEMFLIFIRKSAHEKREQRRWILSEDKQKIWFQYIFVIKNDTLEFKLFMDFKKSFLSFSHSKKKKKKTIVLFLSLKVFVRTLRQQQNLSFIFGVLQDFQKPAFYSVWIESINSGERKKD